jgi:hypothetical protein
LVRDQTDLAPINVCHFNILQNIFQFLRANTDLWSTPDVKAMCVMGDSIITLYDQPTDVVDLTVDEPGVEDEAADNGTENPNLPADALNDSGLAE